MNSEIANEIMEELSSAVERIETQSAAVLDFIKEKGIAKDEELAPYLERAAAASNVRWRATRVRLAHLFAGIEKSEREAKEHEQRPEQKKSEEREHARKSPSAQKVNQEGSAPGAPQGSKAANAASENSGQQKHVVPARTDAATRQQEGPSEETDKRQNAA